MEEVVSVHWDAKPHSRSKRTPGSCKGRSRISAFYSFASHGHLSLLFPYFSGNLTPFLAMGDSGNPPRLWGVTGSHPAKILQDRITFSIVRLRPYQPQSWRSPHECWKTSIQGSMLYLGKCTVKSSDLRRWNIWSGFLISIARQLKLVLEGEKQEENQTWKSFIQKTRTRWTFERQETKWR